MPRRRASVPRPLAVLLGLLSAALPFAVPPPSAHAQQWAKDALAKSPRHGEYVTIHEASGRNLQAWVVYPEIRGKAPVVVMIHEIFGLSDWARAMADEVAAAGYIVIEPDLLSGLGPAAGPVSSPVSSPAASAQPMDMAHMNMGGGSPSVPATPGGTAAFPDQGAAVKAVSSLPDPLVLADLDAVSDYAKHLPAASGKLFVAGFCWGGGKSFLFATHRHDLAAALVFYGPPPAAGLMPAINAPVYGFYAGDDARITSTVDQTRLDMKAAGKLYVPVVYEGAGHGFMRAGEAPDASAVNTAARRAAFHRTVDLLGGAR